jgi:hypothetical protein
LKAVARLQQCQLLFGGCRTDLTIGSPPFSRIAARLWGLVLAQSPIPLEACNDH